MHISYILLSLTFCMHQYATDLANRTAQASHDVSLVTTNHYPRGRFLPDVCTYTSVDTRDTGFLAHTPRFSGALAQCTDL